MLFRSLIADIEGFTLKLSCAKENFSGLYREGDRMIPTTTNRYLFEGSLALPMTGLIRLAGTDLERRLLFASPLYLILNPVDENLGEYNDVEI